MTNTFILHPHDYTSFSITTPDRDTVRPNIHIIVSDSQGARLRDLLIAAYPPKPGRWEPFFDAGRHNHARELNSPRCGAV